MNPKELVWIKNNSTGLEWHVSAEIARERLKEMADVDEEAGELPRPLYSVIDGPTEEAVAPSEATKSPVNKDAK